MCTLYLLTLFIDKINGAEQHNISQTPQLLVLNMFDEHLNQQIVMQFHVFMGLENRTQTKFSGLPTKTRI